MTNLSGVMACKSPTCSSTLISLPPLCTTKETFPPTFESRMSSSRTNWVNSSSLTLIRTSPSSTCWSAGPSGKTTSATSIPVSLGKPVRIADSVSELRPSLRHSSNGLMDHCVWMVPRGTALPSLMHSRARKGRSRGRK